MLTISHRSKLSGVVAAIASLLIFGYYCAEIEGGFSLIGLIFVIIFAGVGIIIPSILDKKIEEKIADDVIERDLNVEDYYEKIVIEDK